MLAWGMRWLSGELQAHAASPVVYSRADLSVALVATYGQTKLRLADEFGAIRIEWTDRDFIVPAAKLKLGGVVILPRRGDLVTVNDGANVTTYEVLATGDEPPWRWCDPFRTMVRIYTKRIKSEAI